MTTSPSFRVLPRHFIEHICFFRWVREITGTPLAESRIEMRCILRKRERKKMTKEIK